MADLIATRRHLLMGMAGATSALGLPLQAQAAAAIPPLRLGSWMKLASVPGASWATLDDEVISDHAEGEAKAGSQVVIAETLFEAASLSKPVLATAIHILARQGTIDLDAPVIERIDFTSDAATRAVTPRHLLSHSSGLPNWRTEPGSALVSRFRPGSAFRYSGEGYVLLGRLAEAVTGRTAAEVVRTHVLKPAGMTRSTYGWPEASAVQVAWPHDADGEVMPDKGPAAYLNAVRQGPHRSVESWTDTDRGAVAKALGKPPLPIYMTPNMAAGLWTTAGEYAQFLRFARRFPVISVPTVAVAGDLAWGQGWGLDRAGGSRFAWHWGANDGVANLFMLDLDRNAGIVVLTNGAGGQRVYERAARIRFGREFDSLTWLQS